jgi:hypothetical protein
MRLNEQSLIIQCYWYEPILAPNHQGRFKVQRLYIRSSGMRETYPHTRVHPRNKFDCLRRSVRAMERCECQYQSWDDIASVQWQLARFHKSVYFGELVEVITPPHERAAQPASKLKRSALTRS